MLLMSVFETGAEFTIYLFSITHTHFFRKALRRHYRIYRILVVNNPSSAVREDS